MKTDCDLTVSIQGGAGVGKTWLLNMIGSVLKEKGIEVECFDDGNVKVEPRAASFSLDRAVRLSVTGESEGNRPRLAGAVKKPRPLEKWERVLEVFLREIESRNFGNLKYGYFNVQSVPEKCIFVRLSDVMHHLSIMTTRSDGVNRMAWPSAYSDRLLKRELTYAGIWIGRSEVQLGDRLFRMDVLSVEALERMGFSVSYPR